MTRVVGKPPTEVNFRRNWTLMHLVSHTSNLTHMYDTIHDFNCIYGTYLNSKFEFSRRGQLSEADVRTCVGHQKYKKDGFVYI